LTDSAKEPGGPGTERPEWIKAKAPSGADFEEVLSLVQNLRLNTICQSARCPNIGECWRERTATFLILGDVCTRNCGFCAVRSGKPSPVDEEEPERVAHAAQSLGLKHAVVTSVTRDDLPDGGASVFAETIRAIKQRLTDCSVEVLIPDFKGSRAALQAVVDARPDVLNHNVETVPRMYSLVRPQADYAASIRLLRWAKEMSPFVIAKSGLMVGIGETSDEIILTMRDLRDAGCEILTIGQYLRPSFDHAPISRYYTPEEFESFRLAGIDMGFRHVESGPLVRSSYHAARAVTLTA
jgi:lipoic acid synthetase